MKLRITIAVAILAGIGIMLVGPLRRPPCTMLTANGSALSVPLAKLARGAAQFFCYRNRAGEKLRFVLARDSEGKVHGVFDACRQCYRFHEGYNLLDDELVCRLCGNRYALENMMAGKASCVPVPLTYEVSGNAVRLSVRDVEAGQWLF